MENSELKGCSQIAWNPSSYPFIPQPVVGTPRASQLLVAACEEVSFPLNYREHAQYDHSYFFIASFIDDHLRFHAKYLA